MKKCPGCGESKDWDNFPVYASSTKSKRASRCRACRAAASKAWREKNPDRKRATGKAWFERNPEKRLEYKKRYRETHAELVKQQVANAHRKYGKKYWRTRWATWMEQKYGLTAPAYYEMLHAQDDRCAICRTDKLDGKREVFCVDHCHATGRVRGLLCLNCNAMLGQARDQINVLQEGIAYLQRFQVPLPAETPPQ